MSVNIRIHSLFLALAAIFAAGSSAQAATRTVCASGCGYTTIQEAIDASGSGDVIMVDADENFAGFTLRNKGALAAPITIRSSADDADLPAAGYRATIGEVHNGVTYGTDYRPFMPNIVGTLALNIVQTEAGAQDYILLGLEFSPGTASAGSQAQVALGFNSTSQQFEADQPQDIVVDRCLFLGGRLWGQKVGLDLNGRNLTVMNSYFQDIKGVGQDAIAIRCINASGPITIVNNFISGAAENFICGGDDPQMRTFAEVSASPAPTTTSATLTNFRPGHTIATAKVGQPIAILAASGAARYQSYIRSCGTSTPGAYCTSAAITFDAVAAAPMSGTGSDIRWGIIPDGFTIRRNHFTKRLEWASNIYQTITGITTSALTGGSLAAGTYYYRIQGYYSAGYQNNKNYGSGSAEVSVTVGASGRAQFTWPAIPDVDNYRIVGRTTGTQSANNTVNRFADVTAASACTGGTCTFIDTGANLAQPVNACGSTSGAQGICPASIWVTKNLFEIKHGTNYQIDSNIFEYHWPGSDSGYSLWIKSNNSGGAAEFAITRDVMFENNIVRHIAGGFNIPGRINSSSGIGENQSFWVTNLTIRNNLFDDSDDPWLLPAGKASVYFIKSEGPLDNLHIINNTIIHRMRGMWLIQWGQGFTETRNPIYRNNITLKETYGFYGSSCTSGLGCLNAMLPSGWTVDGNVIAGVTSGYPTGNVYPTVSEFESDQHFEDYSGGADGNYTLKETSTWKGTAVGGGDPGVNTSILTTATTGVLEGVPQGGAVPLSITTTGLTQGTQGTAYSATLNATGGTTPYSWSIPSGSLPAGLTLNAGTGVISGTPTGSGLSSFTVRVTDSAGTPQQDDQALALTIVGTISTLNITTTTLPNGQIPLAYSQTLALTGGTAPYTWSLASGGLPPGLQILANGVISGIPTTPGTSSFSARVTDAGGIQDTQALSITVLAESFPCQRPNRWNFTETATYRRTTAPTATDCPMIGDIWINTSEQPIRMRLVTQVTPSITFSDPISSGTTTGQTLPANPTEGDIVVGLDDGTWSTLSLGAAGSFLTNSGGSVEWATQIPSSQLSGVVPSANLGTGTASASTFLRGDGSWAAPVASNAIPSTVTMRADAGNYVTTAGSIAGSSSQEVDSNLRHRMMVDFTNVTQVRVGAQVGTGGTTAVVRIDYSTNGGSSWVTTAGVVTSVLSPSNTHAIGSWVNIPVGMKADVLIRPVVTGGNGTEAPSVANIYIQLK